MKKRFSREELTVGECYAVLHEQNLMDISKVFPKNKYYVSRMRKIFKEKYRGKFYNLYFDSLLYNLITLISFILTYVIKSFFAIPLSWSIIMFCFIYSIIDFFVSRGWIYYIGKGLMVKNLVGIKCKFYLPFFVIKRVHFCKYHGKFRIYDDYTLPPDSIVFGSYYCDYAHIPNVVYDHFKNNNGNSIDNIRKPVSYKIWNDYCTIIYGK